MKEWYKESFGQDYLLVYKHRDQQGALSEVGKMIQWLKLPQKARIFDLCCGMGRHSLALADHGFQMTGLDLSEVLLQQARTLDEEKKVTWLQGDMRQIPLAEQSFDAVVNLFTSFGYFAEDSENTKVLMEIDRLLVAGGRFIIDFLNPTYVEAHLVPTSHREEEDVVIIEHRGIEEGCVRKRIQIHADGQPDRHYFEQVKLYQLSDFQQMLSQTELVLDHVYGNYDGAPYEEMNSSRLIMVGTKKGSPRHVS